MDITCPCNGCYVGINGEWRVRTVGGSMEAGNFCPECGAPLHADGTSGPRQDETPEPTVNVLHGSAPGDTYSAAETVPPDSSDHANLRRLAERMVADHGDDEPCEGACIQRAVADGVLSILDELGAARLHLDAHLDAHHPEPIADDVLAELERLRDAATGMPVLHPAMGEYVYAICEAFPALVARVREAEGALIRKCPPLKAACMDCGDDVYVHDVVSGSGRLNVRIGHCIRCRCKAEYAAAEAAEKALAAGKDGAE